MLSSGRAKIENVTKWTIFMFLISALPPEAAFQMSIQIQIQNVFITVCGNTIIAFSYMNSFDSCAAWAYHLLHVLMM